MKSVSGADVFSLNPNSFLRKPNSLGSVYSEIDNQLDSHLFDS